MVLTHMNCRETPELMPNIAAIPRGLCAEPVLTNHPTGQTTQIVCCFAPGPIQGSICFHRAAGQTPSLAEEFCICVVIVDHIIIANYLMILIHNRSNIDNF